MKYAETQRFTINIMRTGTKSTRKLIIGFRFFYQFKLLIFSINNYIENVEKEKINAEH